MKIPELPSHDDYFLPEIYIPLLDQALTKHIEENVPTSKRDEFFRKFKRLYHGIAHDMVRYAVDDHGSYSVNDDELVNPETGLLYTLSDLGFDQEELIGDTSGTFIDTEPERAKHIPLVALALYWAVNK